MPKKPESKIVEEPAAKQEDPAAEQEEQDEEDVRVS